jgi:hypothetical protein
LGHSSVIKPLLRSWMPSLKPLSHSFSMIKFFILWCPCVLCVFALLLLSLLYRLLFLCQHLFKLYFTFISSCCSRVVLGARGSNISPHTCKPQFSTCKPCANLHTGTHVAHHARLVPTLGAPRVGTNVAPHAKPMPTLDLARMLQHKQNTCQLLSCKSRANSYPQVIHRLPHAKLVPTLRPSKTRANSAP